MLLKGGNKDNNCYQTIFFISKKMVVWILNDILTTVKTKFFRLICYYANIKIKFWHNSKTFCRLLYHWGYQSQSFDHLLKTLWHENSAHLNQWDLEKTNHTSTPKWQLPGYSEFASFSTISLHHQKKWTRQYFHLILRKKSCIFKSGIVRIILFFLRFWGKILNFEIRGGVTVQFSRESC